MALIQVACDLCGNTAFELLHASTIGGASNAGQEAGKYFSSSRLLAGHLDIVRCRRCGLVMTNPQDDDETLNQVYFQLEDRVYESEQENRRRTALQHLRLVEGCTPKPGRLLDIGCATGIFLAQARAVGWQVTGLEPSHWAVEQARQRLPQVQIIQGTLENTDFPTESFEAISLWDVLEHVRSPAAALERIGGWLAPDGLIFLNLPNAASLAARLMGSRWVLLLREHLWYFSPQTIAALLQNCGYQLIETRPNTVWFSLGNILGRIGQYPGLTGKLARRLDGLSALRNLSLKFPMGEINVVARK